MPRYRQARSLTYSSCRSKTSRGMFDRSSIPDRLLAVPGVAGRRPAAAAGEAPVRGSHRVVARRCSALDVVGGQDCHPVDALDAASGLQHHWHLGSSAGRSLVSHGACTTRAGSSSPVAAEYKSLVVLRLTVRPGRIRDVAGSFSLWGTTPTASSAPEPSNWRTPCRIRRPVPVNVCSVPSTRSEPVARNSCS